MLFMLGLVGLILLQANKLSNYVKENIGFTIFLNDEVKEADIIRLQKSIDAASYTKSTAYVDKTTAAANLQDELGEDFVNFLGFNPLLSSIDVKLIANYAQPDSIAWIKDQWVQNPKVKEVYYQESLIQAVNENINKISLVLVSFSVLLLIIAIALINNSIRLAVYANRFIIRSMQLVGATSYFIKKPFIIRGVVNGIIGAFIALSLLVSIVIYAQKEFKEIFEINEIELFASLFGLVLLLGIFISWISTSLAVGKYLRMKTDKLY